VACWFRAQLTEQMHRLVLSSEHMRLPSPPSRQKGFRVDGSNLPWVVDRLQHNPARFAQWLAHLQEALPEFRDFSTILREEDRHRTLTAQAAEDVALPSWVLSDGTLRMLALTLLAYVEDLSADLKVVVADGNMQATFAGLLTRHHSLGIRALQLDPQSPLVHPRHDPGCWKDGPELLAIKHQHYRHGLLTSPGWGSIVVLQPELESWVFAGSTEVDRALGWQPGSLTPWLVQQGLLEPGQAKPARPKEAVEHAMNQKRQPRSSSVYRQLSRSVGLSRCTAPVFTELKSTLQQWFPVQAPS